MGTDIATIDAPELKAQASACVEWSRQNQITNPDDFAETAEHLQAVKAALKVADEFFDTPIKQAHELHKMLVGRKRLITGPLMESEAIDKAKLLTYQREEEDKRLAEQRQLQAEADERARREREALEKKAAAARKPETKQKYAEAAEMVMAPVVNVAPVVTPQAAGVQVRKTWKFVIEDREALFAWAAQHQRWDLLLPNEKVIETYARSMKAEAKIPGVRFVEQVSLASRSS